MSNLGVKNGDQVVGNFERAELPPPDGPARTAPTQKGIGTLQQNFMCICLGINVCFDFQTKSS